jgi:hypothetical protein
MVKSGVYLAAVIVFGICLFAFLLGSQVFDGEFKNDPIAWYFLAKGIFCSLSLCLAYAMLDALKTARK